MKALEILNVEHPSEEMIKFIRFACKELGLKELPKIKFVTEPIQNDQSNSFAAFQPDTSEITLYTKGRHLLDICRSLAHEMVHFKQKLDHGNDLDGRTGSAHENEANAIAGQIMRKYNKENLELF